MDYIKNEKVEDIMKKRFTKLMAMLLAGAMVLSLAACGGSSEESSG